MRPVTFLTRRSLLRAVAGGGALALLLPATGAIDPVAWQMHRTIRLDRAPRLLAIHKFAGQVLVGLEKYEGLIVLDDTAKQKRMVIPIDGVPYAIETAPTSANAYVATQGNDGHRLAVVDTLARKVIATVTLAEGPVELGVDHEANLAYLSVLNDQNPRVFVVDLTTNTLIATLHPYHDVAVT